MSTSLKRISTIGIALVLPEGVTRVGLVRILEDHPARPIPKNAPTLSR